MKEASEFQEVQMWSFIVEFDLKILFRDHTYPQCGIDEIFAISVNNAYKYEGIERLNFLSSSQ